jgi:hypothetical protein
MFGRARGGNDWKTDPDARALLYVAQYLAERGGAGGALAALERASGVAFDAGKACRAGALMALVHAELQAEASAAAGGGGELDSDDEAREGLLRDALGGAAGGLATRPGGVAARAHGASNVLCVRVVRDGAGAAEEEQDGADAAAPRPLLVASGAADGTVRLHRFEAAAGAPAPPELVWEAALSLGSGGGGVLSIDATTATAVGGRRRRRRVLLACTTMGGCVAVLDGATGRLLGRARAHTKYAVRARWAAAFPPPPRASSPAAPPGGRPPPLLLATASWDGSAALLRVMATGEEEEEVEDEDEEGEARPGSGINDDEPPLEQLPPLLDDEGASPLPSWRIELVRRARFAAACLDVAFVRRRAPSASSADEGEESSGGNDKNDDDLLLVAAVRGSSHLAALVCTKKAGLVPAAWLSGGRGLPLAYAPPAAAAAGGGSQASPAHERVPFSAVRLAASPCGTRLLAATDGGRVLVLRQRRGGGSEGGARWAQLPPLFGVSGGGDIFHVPSLAWHRSGAHAYVSTAAAGGGARAAEAVTAAQRGDGEGAGERAAAAPAASGVSGGEVFVFDVGAGRVVARLPAHSPLAARDLDYCARRNALATCAFDKTVRVFVGGGGGAAAGVGGGEEEEEQLRRREARVQ